MGRPFARAVVVVAVCAFAVTGRAAGIDLPETAALTEADGAIRVVEHVNQVTAIVHVNVVPMTADRVDSDQTVLIVGGEITAVGPSQQVAVPGNADVIHGDGAYLMPGLADMHVHTREDWMGGRWPVRPMYLYLANGITTIRDFGPTGSDLTYALRWRDELDSGAMTGPALFTSGMHVRYDTGTTMSPQEIVQWNSTQGFDFLKIYSYLTYADYQEAMATSRQLGMYTAGHIPYTVGLGGVIAEGMNEIAHIEELDWEFVDFDRNASLPWADWLPFVIGRVLQQFDISAGFDRDDFLAEYGDRLATVVGLLRSNQVPVCTTMIIDDRIVEKLFAPEEFLSRPEIIYLPQDYLQAFMAGVEKHQLQFLGIEDLAHYKFELDKLLLDELHRAGVPLLLSTDSGGGNMGIVPGFSIHDELQILIENGFTPFEAIATGTVNAARVAEEMVGSGDFGTVEVGKRADLILVDGNPLDDVENMRTPLGVMAGGKWYSAASLRRMIAVARWRRPSGRVTP